MKTIAIIPARGGSKRLPGKNIKRLGEKPLIAHSIEYAKANPDIIDAVVVSTDDPEIKKVALSYGVIVIDRPEVLSGDLEPTVTALKHVLQTLEIVPENVVLLQATNPLRPETLLKDSFEKYRRSGTDSLFSVTPIIRKLGKITDQKFVPFNYQIGQRSQDMEPLYFENGLLYISKAELILKEEKIISEQAIPWIVEHPFADLDIDTEADFEYADYLYHKYKIQN
ncbi:acylneuraminate cytidylyltransferase family protein [Flavobacterium cerinum]|uniref:Acylneuraminate cytidylyltransferase family protein n=1 Tax=Flavobacterium cerinum TaxID=2502784 RepID=A0ABY5IW31_9FLAO|nr:acylneuraminate cytidylyltransferase family protein [Flavobacterium cerinum]UUC47041.1 acylneuraminate cytidylyltransferase family protein [Flavobacterium cerinum]